MKNPKLSTAAVNAQAAAYALLLDNGYFRIYDGAQPASVADPITDQTMLAELRFGAPAFGDPADGVITANSLTADPSAAATGAPTWYRQFKADGTTAIEDGSVGVKDQPNEGDRYDLELNSATINLGVEVSLSPWSHTVPKL